MSILYLYYRLNILYLYYRVKHNYICDLDGNTLTYLPLHNGMASVKILANQARSIYQNKSIRTRVLQCCADIFLTDSVSPKELFRIMQT